MNHEAIASVQVPYHPQHHHQPTSCLDEDSIDFSALEDYFPLPSNNTRKNTTACSSMLNDCSHADTLSTAGESSSWGSSCEYDYSAGAIAGDDDDKDDDNDSEGSLTLDDLKSFFVEDQVGIFNPSRDDLPPPKARTDYKGDSQNSFTLEDLALDFEDDTEEEGDNDEEGSLGCLLTPSSSSRRQSSRRRRKSSLKQSPLLEPPTPTLKGILKNGHCNTRRSSSLTMLMMEDSSMFQLSLTGGGDGLLGDDGEDSMLMDGWGLMQQSFCEQELDLAALQEKRVDFSSVVVHLHPVVVGDNPSVSEGVPLQLDWQAQESTTYKSVDEYEGNREQPPAFPVRKLEAEERMFRLLNAGASLHDIQQAEASVNKTRTEREATRQQNLMGGPRTVFWKAIQHEQEESEEPDLLQPRGIRRKKSPPLL